MLVFEPNTWARKKNWYCYRQWQQIGSWPGKLQSYAIVDHIYFDVKDDTFYIFSLIFSIDCIGQNVTCSILSWTSVITHCQSAYFGTSWNLPTSSLENTFRSRSEIQFIATYYKSSYRIQTTYVNHVFSRQQDSVVVNDDSSRRPRHRTIGPNCKIAPKIRFLKNREIDWAYLWVQQFDEFWKSTAEREMLNDAL